MKSVLSAPKWETRLLAIITGVLLVVGIVAVYGASSIVAVQQGEPGSSFALRHAVGAVVGTLVLLVTSRMDYHVWERSAWTLLAVVFVALVVLLLPFAGPLVREVNGAKRWLSLGPVTLQPAEMAKFAVIAWTAMLAAKKQQKIRDFKTGLIPFVVVLAPVALVILLEPALSTTVITLMVAGIVVFAAGAKIGHFLILGLAAVPILWQQIADVQYRLTRVLTFLGPGENLETSGYQIQQSLIGMGAGRWFGTGFGEGTQKLGFLPYAYSDFIFSTIGEEWGFAGVVFMLVAFGAFVWLGIRVAQSAPDQFGMLLAVGLTSMIGLTAAFHMAVTLDILPTTGLPLPFVSYGRSNLLVSMLAVGVLMSIGDPRRPGRTGRAR